MTRRELLQTTTAGFGSIGLATAASTLDPKTPHHTPKAKHVIFLFLNGGPSQVDTFDYKPSLAKYHGKAMPGDYPKAKQERGTLLQSPFKFKQHGQSGLYASELFAKTAQHMDDICVINSMHTDLPAHPQAIIQMNSGRIIPGFPSWGSGSLMASVLKIKISPASSPSAPASPTSAPNSGPAPSSPASIKAPTSPMTNSPRRK